MRLVSYIHNNATQLGILIGSDIYNLAEASNNKIPNEMLAFLRAGEEAMSDAREIEKQLSSNNIKVKPVQITDKNLLAPIPNPTSCRDGYAFRQHVASARRNRGVPMIPEFDEYPIFYFTNHQAIFGPGDLYCMPDHF